MSGILVPLGGTAQDDEVIELACMLARQTHNPICFLHVIRVPRTLSVDAYLPDQTQRGDAVLLRAEQEATRQGVELDTVLAQAREVGSAIVNGAVDRSSDLIVIRIDRDRRSGIYHVGENASLVLERAPCPVIARRQPLPETSGRGGR